MKHTSRAFLISLSLLLVISGLTFAGGFKYDVKKDHKGGNVTPSQAYEMLQKDPEHTFLVDARTRAEYQLIGHPVGAYLVPNKFWNGKLGEKKYGMTVNPNFGQDLLARFNPKTDKLIFMCRSGGRSCAVCNEAVKAGWSEKAVCNMLGGFEGDKIKDKHSAYHGQRKYGGWRNEGLPWTYHVDKELVYKADLAS